MSKKKIISLEKFFLNYLKRQSLIYGVIGDWKTKNFLVFDNNFMIIYQDDKVFNNQGEFTKKVEDKIKSLKSNQSLQDSNLHLDENVDMLIYSILLHCKMKYLEEFTSTEKNTSDESEFDIEANSKEFDEFETIFYYMSNAIKSNSTKHDNIEYHLFSDKGKKMVDDGKKWFDENTSITPIQDAWVKVLQANGSLPTNYKPCDKWCVLPVMKKINYNTKF